MNKLAQYLLIICMTVSLIQCGGGGGGSDTFDSPFESVSVGQMDEDGTSMIEVPFSLFGEDTEEGDFDDITFDVSVNDSSLYSDEDAADYISGSSLKFYIDDLEDNDDFTITFYDDDGDVIAVYMGKISDTEDSFAENPEDYQDIAKVAFPVIEVINRVIGSRGILDYDNYDDNSDEFDEDDADDDQELEIDVESDCSEDGEVITEGTTNYSPEVTDDDDGQMTIDSEYSSEFDGCEQSVSYYSSGASDYCDTEVAIEGSVSSDYNVVYMWSDDNDDFYETQQAGDFDTYEATASYTASLTVEVDGDEYEVSIDISYTSSYDYDDDDSSDYDYSGTITIDGTTYNIDTVQYAVDIAEDIDDVCAD
jgi:hypothetical protein